MRQIIDDLRSAVSLFVLAFVMGIAPQSEKTSLALALRDHVNRVHAADKRMKKA